MGPAEDAVEQEGEGHHRQQVQRQDQGALEKAPGHAQGVVAHGQQQGHQADARSRGQDHAHVPQPEEEFPPLAPLCRWCGLEQAQGQKGFHTRHEYASVKKS